MPKVTDDSASSGKLQTGNSKAALSSNYVKYYLFEFNNPIKLHQILHNCQQTEVNSIFVEIELLQLNIIMLIFYQSQTTEFI